MNEANAEKKEANNRRRQVNVDHFYERLKLLARRNRFTLEPYGMVNSQPLYVLRRKAAGDNIIEAPTIYLSAGIHGDEPAGPLTILRLLDRGALPTSINWIIFPLLNPTGFAARTRENHAGRDLNRAYAAVAEDASAREIGFHRQWIEKHVNRIDLCLCLHEDWEADGFYLYELNFDQREAPTEAVLETTRKHVPTLSTAQIDGWEAQAGVIRPSEVPTVAEGLPESLYLYQGFGSLGYTLETPSSLPLPNRIDALADAILSASAGMAKAK